MNNFLDFIDNDINVRKEMLSSLPTKTKSNIKKYNDTVEEFINKYESYKEGVFKYINAKEKALNPKVQEKNKSQYDDQIKELEKYRLLLNPVNNYYEKLGFDELIYRLSNYYVFNFDSVDLIINEFIDRFKEAGIILTVKDFDYTYYVTSYMSLFLDVRNNINNKTKEDLDNLFEEIYWSNPDLISHIELNFRKLIKKYSRKLDSYISKKKKDISKEYNIRSYSDCLVRINDLYEMKNKLMAEDFSDIVNKAINKEFDVSQLLEGNKFRKSAYDSLIPESIDLNNEAAMDKIYVSLEKLNDNLREYEEFDKIQPLVEDFKNTYYKLIGSNSRENQIAIKSIENEIKKNETDLERINRKISRNFGDIKLLKMESVRKSKELYSLYKKHDDQYFVNKVTSIINPNMSVSDMLELYYSFDAFKKRNIQRVYELKVYNDVVEQSKIFDHFAMNPTNNIVDGLPVFEDYKIPRIISNKYILSNIKISENDITPENIVSISNKISLITRVNKITRNNMSVDQLWFLQKANEIINKNNQE